VARYFTPTGRSIQKSYDEDADYDGDLSNRMTSGELFNQDSIVLLDTTRFYTKKEKRIVYGGGGITPDIFVPVDSLELNYNLLLVREHVPQFVYRQLENKTTVPAEKKLSDWQKEYQVSDQMIRELASYVSDKGVDLTEAELNEITPLLKTIVKARVARQYFGPEGSFSVLNSQDAVVIKALKALRGTEVMTEKR